MEIYQVTCCYPKENFDQKVVLNFRVVRGMIHNYPLQDMNNHTDWKDVLAHLALTNRAKRLYHNLIRLCTQCDV